MEKDGRVELSNELRKVLLKKLEADSDFVSADSGVDTLSPCTYHCSGTLTNFTFIELTSKPREVQYTVTIIVRVASISNLPLPSKFNVALYH